MTIKDRKDLEFAYSFLGQEDGPAAKQSVLDSVYAQYVEDKRLPDYEPEQDETATCVYLHDLYDIAPQAHIFIVTRDDELRITSRREYNGGKEDGDKIVWRVTPASYPMYKNVLEVEII